MVSKADNWTSIAKTINDWLWLPMIQINRGEANPTVDQGESDEIGTPPNEPPRPPGNDSALQRESLLRWLECILIFLCFALFAGQLPPDVNESHYLTKAKHFWDPEWAEGDIFLASSFAHWLFYVSSGWLTKFLSLFAFAWVGRVATWALLAFAWQAMCRSFIRAKWSSVFSAIVFLILNDRFHLAGEWVVGGFEAKGFAYFFVMLALAEVGKQSWKRVWPWLGAATAFHVLVGGWSIIAMLFAWLGSMWLDLDGQRDFFRQFVARIKEQILPLSMGAAIGLIGVVPPLLSDSMATPQDTTLAQQFYVNHRIAHHLTFSAFPTMHVARFTLVVLFWVVLHRWLKHRWLVGYRNLRPLFLFGLGCLLISFGGLLLSGLAEQSDTLAARCAGLLRFYWFRLSDFAIPCGTAISSTALLGYWIKINRRSATRFSAFVFVTCIVLAFATMVFERHHDPRPRADRRSLPDYPDNVERTQGTYRNWLKVCQWISNNTPVDATFITPAQQQSFKWYTGRAEVVCWKDIPQDASGILIWNQRLMRLNVPQRRQEIGLLSYSDDQLKELAAEYGATHLLIPQSCVDLTSPPPKLNQIYPEDPASKSTYVIYELE